MRKKITNMTVAITIFLLAFVPAMLLFNRIGLDYYLNFLVSLIFAIFIKMNVTFEVY